jgi:hypothetical protein
LLNRLEAAEKLIVLGQRAPSVLVLCFLRETVNGCGSGPDRDDWPLNCQDQLTVRALLDQLIANLGGAPGCPKPGKDTK